MIRSEDIIDVTDMFSREIEIVKSRMGGLCELLKAGHGILAGGTFTSLLSKQDINDFDIYFTHREGLAHVLSILYSHYKDVPSYKDYGLSYFEVRFNHMTDKSLLALRDDEEDIQFILYRMFSGGIPQIFSEFDFTINMFAYDFYTGRMLAHKDAIKHLSQRVLVINEGTRYPLVSVLRTKKYESRGFTTSKAQMLNLLLSVSQKRYNSWEVVIDEVGSMYGIEADKLFDQTAPFSIAEVQKQLEEKSFHLENAKVRVLNVPTLEDIVKKFQHREDVISPEFREDVLNRSWSEQGKFRFVDDEEVIF